MSSQPSSINAIVVGASGGLGQALTDALLARPEVARLFALSRRPVPANHRGPAPAAPSSGPTTAPARERLTWLDADATEPASLAHAARTVAATTSRVHLLVTCTGVLHGGDARPGLRPEKALAQLDAEGFLHVMRVNALAPLQVLAAFAPLLRHDQRAVAATLSAMVGSIGDNRLGGWYSYRMSKAALNMGLKNAAIELGRGARDGPIVVAIHPGTTTTALSEPFLRHRTARSPAESAEHILAVLDGLTPANSGKFYNWDGRELPW